MGGDVKKCKHECVGGWIEDDQGVVWPCPLGCPDLIARKLTLQCCQYAGECDYKVRICPND